MKKILPLLFLIVFLSSCQSAQDAFTLKKKTSSDEFLVEKKKPFSYATKLWRASLS